MTAIVRIKRNCTEDPLDAVLINCKKRKVDDGDTVDNEKVSTVLNFAGTVTDSDADVLKHIHKLTKTEAEQQYKKHKVNIGEKLRLENQINSKNNRYKVVNSHRFTNQSLDDTDDCTVYDVEPTGNDTEGSASTASGYVYDLYYTNSDDFGEPDLNEFISVYPLSDGLVYETARDSVFQYSESDSEDSNAENHWKNDYPDESDLDFGNSDDDDDDVDEARTSFKAMGLYTTVDLSSDNYDDDYDEQAYYEGSCTP